MKAKLRDLNRRLGDIRKMEHNILANELLEHGNEFVVEDMNYKALQKRSKETKVNPKTGRAHTKKRFGKSLKPLRPRNVYFHPEQKSQSLWRQRYQSQHL